MEQKICGIWSTPALTVPADHYSKTRCFSPRVLGDYFYFGQGVIPNLDDRVRVKLTSWIIEQREHLSQDQSVSNKFPMIDPEVINEIKKAKGLKVERRAELTIEFLKFNSLELGTVVTIPRFDVDDGSLPVEKFKNKYKVLHRLLCVSECVDDSELRMVLTRLHRTKKIELYSSNSDFKVMI